MSLSRLASIPLAATVALAVFPSHVFAAPVVYDARSLGMAGSTVGYAENASLAYWNPAAVANGKKFGLFLPSIALSASNNVLGVSTLASLAREGSNPEALLGQLLAPTGEASVLTRLGGSDGLNIQARALFEPFGFSLANVGPGGLALRVYGGTVAMGGLRVSSDFAQDANNLIVGKGYQKIVAAATDLGDAARSGLGGDLTQLQGSVEGLRAAIEANMSSFIIDGTKKKAAATKEFSATVMSGTAGTIAATYAQPLPLPAAVTKAFPEAQLTLGATGKILQSGMGFLGAGLNQTLPGGSTSGRFNPTAGSVTVSMDLDQEVTDLLGAVKGFNEEQNLATVGDLLASVQGFLAGIPKTAIQFTSLAPANNGVAADLGAHFRFNRWWSVGMTLVNPVLFWNAQRTTYRYRYDASSTTQPLQLEQVGGVDNVTFRVAEPFSFRAGLAFTPQLAGKGALGLLTNGIVMTAGLDAPIITGLDLPNRPVLSLGFEKAVGPLALRLGTQQFGAVPFYTAGLGLQTPWVQLNVGAGADLPALRGGAVSATMGVGF